MKISENFVELKTPEELKEVVRLHGEAWKHPDLPVLQFAGIVLSELERYAMGHMVAPFDAFIKCIRRIPVVNDQATTLLDVGAASGYYSKVLSLRGFKFQYFGIDFSDYFTRYAQRTFPGINFRTGDARYIPYGRQAFHIVASGGCLMHVLEYEQIIAEMVRVTSRYVLLHRTPVFTDDRPTTFFKKDAYGIPCLEIHFQQEELLKLFRKYDMRIIHTEDVFPLADGFVQRNYLLEKELFHQPV